MALDDILAAIRVVASGDGLIAAKLSISVATAKTCLTRLLAKLDARDRVQLVILAYETGLVAPPGWALSGALRHGTRGAPFRTLARCRDREYPKQKLPRQKQPPYPVSPCGVP